MISRRSAKAIADAYYSKFSYYSSGSAQSKSRSRVYTDALYDFLYLYNFDSWLLNTVKKLSRTNRRGLLEFLMRFHTGESAANATPEWDWLQREKLGQRILRDLAQALITARLQDPDFGGFQDRHLEPVDTMRKELELDGYIYENGVLLVPDESILDAEEEQSLLQNLYTHLGLPNIHTLTHHLNLSVEHYQNQKWDDSISNSRKVLELVLREIALKYARHNQLQTNEKQFERPVYVRDFLEREGLVEQKEKEAVAKIYGLLSNTGSHPYIAQNDQARLLRHYALTTCQFALLRLKGALQSSPS